MNTPTRVAAFAGGLAAVFAAAIGVGTLTGPVGTASTSSTAEPAGHDDGHPDNGTSEQTTAEDLPGGLMVSQDGYTFDLAQRQLPATEKAPVQFRILGPDGRAVTRYTTAHGKDLHLVVVRRDLTDFQHVHPQLDRQGTWSVPLDLSDAGAYRLFADFTPADRDDNLTLGADLSVAGDYQPEALPATSRTAEVDGYTVTLDGALEPGQEAELTLSVSKDGQPVTDLQPYLGAYGHLVALRDRDLAYLHVHPAGTPGDGQTQPGPAVTLYATVPSAGNYRLFLDFRHGDQVRTAAFTVTAGTTDRPPEPAAPSPAQPSDPASEADDGHGHGG
ncbi:MAG: FIG00995371: possibly secreted protein [uncultured Friedmanniella sp.]|uniref:FIG00995371: possibly secreted protein n=1 Tax=uncultured Friedmanniella sp. TaxID=335381 RepID=A0A6J4KR46_9ACTN|nr:MAG: FIG00995371: possibly secreted protein [uncultured Friedmanniella sp.]